MSLMKEGALGTSTLRSGIYQSKGESGGREVSLQKTDGKPLEEQGTGKNNDLRRRWFIKLVMERRMEGGGRYEETEWTMGDNEVTAKNELRGGKKREGKRGLTL